MFFKKRLFSSSPPSGQGAENLEAAVRSELEGADEATIAIVTAIAGLMATVAYADREISDGEIRLLESELARIHGLGERGARALTATLTDHVLDVSTTSRSRLTRALREHGDRELRLMVLSLLVDLAAADGEVSHPEVQLLRQITPALGLTQDDYNELQRKHRDKLGSLR